MALGTREHATYLRFQAGQVLWSRGNEKGAVDYVEGVVTGVRYEDREFEYQGKKIQKRNFVVSLQDGNEKYILTDGVDSNSGLQLQNKLLNTAIGDRIRISPSKKDDVRDGKPVVVTSGVFVNIGRSSVPQKYNKENPGDLPPWKQVTVSGKTLWDKTDQLLFFEEKLTEHFANAAAVEQASQQGEFHESEIPQWDDSPSGDVPF
jgi:hypothetical protein